MDINKIYSVFKDCNSTVCTDTREIKAGSLFVALKGASFDGNKYIEKALKEGCSFALSDDTNYSDRENVIVVDDTLSILQELANFHRKQFNIPVIGITGTNGKTTTKELLAVVLEKKYNVLWTKGNLNNHLGVPFTLLNMNANHEIAIIEMGANHIGDIDELCQIAEPNFGLITNIGSAHLEGFGDLNGVIQTKTEMYRYIESMKGSVFLNLNEDLLKKQSTTLTSPLVYGEGGQYNFQIIQNSDQLSLTINNLRIDTHLFGVYNANNVLTSYTVGKYFKVSDEDIKKAIENYHPTNNRSQIKTTARKNRLILDAYNANPTSMNLAIDEFLESEGDKVFILGEMKELGSFSQNEHIKILERLNDFDGDVNYVGMEFKYFEKRYSGNFYANIEKLKAANALSGISNSSILIKGSRSVKLDLLEEFL